MVSIFVFSQHLKLESFENFVNLGSKEKNVFLTTHFLFENERKMLENFFDNCVFFMFADFLTDTEMAECDSASYVEGDISHYNYEYRVKKKKNELIVDKIIKKYPDYAGYILCDDLGIDARVWKRKNYKRIWGEYYNIPNVTIGYKIKKTISSYKSIKDIYIYIHDAFKHNSKFQYDSSEVFASTYKGRKYVFLGKMDRIRYRLDLEFEESAEECELLNKGEFRKKDDCTYFTTWHEQEKCKIPDSDDYDVRWAQDGYLPPNYTHYDYSFKPSNVKYYCWDVLGTELFKNRNLPYELIPFRKKLYLPTPEFPKEVRNILIVASGAGDWTALKNRSDDDIMVDAFVQMAKKFPNIKFTYRCHPTWTLPVIAGVNSINRVKEYFDSLGLDNIALSSNIPISCDQGKTQLTFSRSSLEQDLEKTDFVFGEHSISMIDAGFKAIPFASVNLTNRRNFFVGINNLGFPSCTTLSEIEELIRRVTLDEFRRDYLTAINNYNIMTDMDG